MKAITNPISAYRSAHKLLWKKQFWKYLTWPICISILVSILFFAAYLAVGDWMISAVERLFFDEEKIPAWLKALFWIVVLFQFSGPLYVAFRSLVMICFGPFLDELSVEIEREIKSAEYHAERTFWESIKRPALMFLITFALSISVMIAGIALGFVPLVGFILALLLQFPAQMFLSGVSYIDPYLDRAGYAPKASLRAIRQHFWGTSAFGVVGLAAQAIPIVGWIIGPTYSVVAGVIYGIQIEADSPLAKTMPIPEEAAG
ncbi:EI24 domain-containing protein [Cerasicoccus frondis]|uniref:EI24 domain-containing protein n=1 Tax=Cerasicoccus frondis TaxID=490090 RepID=UPI002852779A|nr:EI24 domain-containing protein [Cerasicoccus frondis]